jgi:hypothetical protein
MFTTKRNILDCIVLILNCMENGQDRVDDWEAFNPRKVRDEG